uniref:Uncharacterized protein n=1 Tax=Nelumbo nucifera TaxID=4432 RepID=A0A822YCW5_NELNU|nr:TPA_asm: hypothetical protein HUJ06_031640 [Nelumbo nucifera]
MEHGHSYFGRGNLDVFSGRDPCVAFPLCQLNLTSRPTGAPCSTTAFHTAIRAASTSSTTTTIFPSSSPPPTPTPPLRFNSPPSSSKADFSAVVANWLFSSFLSIAEESIGVKGTRCKRQSATKATDWGSLGLMDQRRGWRGLAGWMKGSGGGDGVYWWPLKAETTLRERSRELTRSGTRVWREAMRCCWARCWVSMLTSSC